MEYVATFKTSAQISPDDFVVINPSMKVTSETTVEQIQKWYDSSHGGSHFEIKLIRLEAKAD